MAEVMLTGKIDKKFQCLRIIKHNMVRKASLTHPQTDLSNNNPKDVNEQMK